MIAGLQLAVIWGRLALAVVRQLHPSTSKQQQLLLRLSLSLTTRVLANSQARNVTPTKRREP